MKEALSRRLKRGLALATAILLSVTSAVVAPAAKTYAATSSTTITLQNTSSPLGMRYFGTNVNPLDYFSNSSNMTKFMGDMGYDIGRIFPSKIEYKDASTGSGVTDSTSYNNHKAAVKADPFGSGYIDWDVFRKGVQDVLGDSIAEMRKAGVEPLVVLQAGNSIAPHVPQKGPTAADWQGMWDWWLYCYATSYVLAQQFGVVNFNTPNEPNDGGVYPNLTGAQLADIITEENDAVKAAVPEADSSLAAKIWGPTTIGMGGTLADYVMNNIANKIDVYDFHLYRSTKSDIDSYTATNKARITGSSNPNIPYSTSEFNWTLSKNVTDTNALDDMSTVLKVMNAVKYHVDNGNYAPIHFKLTRSYRGGASDGTYPIALVKSDDTTSDLDTPMKAYYAMRMMNRALKYDGAKHNSIDFTLSGTTTGVTAMATETGEDYFVLLMNNSADLKNYTVDLSALGVSSGVATAREVSDAKKDENIGTYTISSGQFTVSGLPAFSAHLFNIRKVANPPYPLKLHTAEQKTGNIELWWKMARTATSYNVYRSTDGGATWGTALATDLQNAWYTDKTAATGTDYWYKVTAVNAYGESNDSNVLGPIQRKNDGMSLPWKDGFEFGDDSDWTKVNIGPGSPSWVITQYDDDKTYRGHPASGNTDLAVNGGSWKDVELISGVKINDYGTGGKFGLIARYTDQNNYYLFQYDHSTTPATVSIIKYSGGVKTTLDSAQPSGLSMGVGGQRRDLKVDVNGGQLDFYLNGSKYASATDANPLTAGKAGFMTADGADIGFDGITVAPYFSDTFDSDKRGEWVQNGGTWSVASGAYKQTATGSNDVTSVIGNATTTGDSAWEDFNLEAKIRFDTATDANASAQLYTRFVDSNNWVKYALKYNPSGTSQLVVSKDVAGTVTTVDTASLPRLATGTWYTVHVQIENNRHRVYMDGTTYFDGDIYEPALESGRAGIGTSKAAASFDNVAVNKLIQ